MSLGTIQRLNKYSPLFLLINIVQQTIFPTIVGLYSFTKYTEKYVRNQDNAALVIIALVSFFSLLSLLQYWFYHYRISEDDLEIKEGILFKNNRKIPYTRIQNVNIMQNPLHRILGVATVQLESASGGKPEAVMRVVGLDQVELIRNRVKFSSEEAIANVESDSQTETDEPHIDTQKPLLRLTSKEVAQYGIVSQKGLLMVAIIAGFLYQFEALWEKYYLYLGVFFKKPDFMNWGLWETASYVIIGALVVLVLLQILSIAWAFLRFYDFTLTKDSQRLQAQMGLLSKLSATIPIKRIQLTRIRENPLHRWFKKQTITIETAGGVNTEQQGITMRWLAPLIKRQALADFFHAIDEKMNLANLNWQKIPQRAWLRVFKRLMIIASLITLPLLYFKSIYIIFALPIFVPLAFFYAKASVRNTLYYVDDDLISFKSGVFFKTQSHVRMSKVQSVELMESPFDRRNDMATVEIDTAGSNVLLHHVRIPYLDLKQAQNLRNHVIKRLQELEFDW